MDLQQMTEYLNNIQQERFETKALNAILACFEEISRLKEALVETQEKMNEIIEEINGKEETETSQVVEVEAEEVQE